MNLKFLNYRTSGPRARYNERKKAMIRNRKLLGSMLAIAFLTASPAAMFAQQKPAEVPPTFQREKIPMSPEIQIGSMDDSFVYVASEMSFDGKLVKGAPYSAQAVTEMTQMLIDGNRIVKKSVASIYRDSEGRTRRDQALKAIGPFAATGSEAPQTIFISDPVAGVHYVLDGRTRTARKMPAFRFEWKTPMAPPPGSTRVMVQPEGPGPEGAVKMRTEGTFTVTAPPHSGDTGVVMQYRTDSRKRGKSEPLGKQLVEGVE